MRLVNERGPWPLPPDVLLPDKDRPVLSAALQCGATHLITGDVSHFGEWFGRHIGRLLVLRPGAYLASRDPADPPPPRPTLVPA